MEDQGEEGELRGRSRRSIPRDRSENVRGSRQKVHDEARLIPVTLNYRRLDRLVRV